MLHGSSVEEIETYRVEPYVVAADVYGAPPHTGRVSSVSVVVVNWIDAVYDVANHAETASRFDHSNNASNPTTNPPMGLRKSHQRRSRSVLIRYPADASPLHANLALVARGGQVGRPWPGVSSGDNPTATQAVRTLLSFRE